MELKEGAESIGHQSSWKIEVFSHMGGRAQQEDRYLINPRIPICGDEEVAAFFGVWDGTGKIIINIPKLAL